MQPQGSSITNAAYYAEQKLQMAGCTVCAQLQAQVNKVFASLQAGKTACAAQLAFLAPIIALITAPTNPTEVITWIGNFISHYLTPYVVPYTVYTTQLAELTAKVVELTDAINNAKAKIPGCSITIPPLT